LATVSTTQASPREAPAAATATAWLAAYLHDGPRSSGQLHRDAEQVGLSRYYLYRASEALAVQRLNRGPRSTWALPQHFVPEPVEKRCDVCGEIRDAEDFRRPATPTHPRGRVVPACSKCTAARSRRTDKLKTCRTCGHRQALDQFRRFARKRDGLDPQCRSCWAVAYRQGDGAVTPPVPGDPVVAIRLREELVAARGAGQTYAEAWPTAMATAVGAAAPRERDDWRDALLETSSAWRAAYDREDALDHHQALAMLAAAA
jgi:hypothetical protein